MKKGSVTAFSLAFIFLITSLLSVFNISSAQAASTQNDWNLVSQVGGTTQAVAVRDTYLYLGVGWHVEIYDISNPDEMVLLGTSEILFDPIESLFTNNSNYLYAACGSSGLQILDISDPSDPRLAGSYNTLGYSEDVYVLDDHAILADGPNGIQIIDISDPQEPKQAAEAYSLTYVYDIEITGDTVFAAAGGSGMLVVDLTDPEQPQEIELIDMSGFVYGLTLSENSIYTANAWGGVGIVDITDIKEPHVVDYVETDGWAMSVSHQEDDLLVMDGANGVRLYDISSQTPGFSGIYTETGFTYQGILNEEKAFLTDKEKGLLIIDFSNPDEPFLSARYLPILDARRVTMQDSMAYIAAGLSGMRAIDLSDPSNPEETYWFDTESAYANKVIASGKTAYLSNHLDTNYPLRIFDISDPQHPEKITEMTYTDEFYGTAFRSMALLNNFLYIAAEGTDVAIDVGDPANPTVTSILPYEDNNAAAFGNLYAAVSTTEICIFDISDPATLQLMSVYERDSAGEGIAFLDQNTIVVSGDNGIWIMDVSDPASPSKRSELEVPGAFATEIFIVGNTAYVSCLGNGIQIVDLSDPDQPQLIGEVDTQSIATDCYVADDLMLVAGSDSGLLIFERGSQTAANNGSSSAASPIQTAGFEALPALPVKTQLQPIHLISKESKIITVDYSIQTEKTCTVTSIEDSGEGSFRECLSKLTKGSTITFDPQVFPASDPSTIFTNSALPEVNVDGITIDASNAGVILDGSQQESGMGLQIYASNSRIMGLQIINFHDQGIKIHGDNNQLGGNRLNGSAPTGEGNLISGNWNNGIYLGGNNNIVIGNLIGTDVSSSTSFPNNVGLFVSEFCESCVIGSSIPGEENVLSGNSYSNLTTWGNHTIIQGNIFGLDINGTTAVKPDTSSNILIESGACNTLVGGTEADERNIISGAFIGVAFSDWPSYQNTVIGNYIGTDITGMKSIPNQDGIAIFTVSYSRIGGTEDGEANLISGNRNGISLNGWSASDNIILGNSLGYDATGEANLPNGTGISIDTGQKHTIIGGYTSAEGNLLFSDEFALRITGKGIKHTYIAGNNIQQNGIILEGHSAENFLQGNTFTNIGADAIRVDYGTGNLLRENQFTMELQYAILLVEGGNLELAAPVVNSANAYTIAGNACPDCYIEIYSVTGNTTSFIGKTIADEDGDFLFESCVPLPGEEIVLTAIDAYGNTSAFSNPIPYTIDDTGRPEKCGMSTD